VRTYVVLLLNRQGVPWSDRKALRLVAAMSPEEAVREAYDYPPSYDVSVAWVAELGASQPVHIPVKVPRPEWDVANVKEAAT